MLKYFLLLTLMVCPSLLAAEMQSVKPEGLSQSDSKASELTEHKISKFTIKLPSYFHRYKESSHFMDETKQRYAMISLEPFDISLASPHEYASTYEYFEKAISKGTFENESWLKSYENIDRMEKVETDKYIAFIIQGLPKIGKDAKIFSTSVYLFNKKHEWQLGLDMRSDKAENYLVTSKQLDDIISSVKGTD